MRVPPRATVTIQMHLTLFKGDPLNSYFQCRLCDAFRCAFKGNPLNSPLNVNLIPLVESAHYSNVIR
jgi:hypothetical protein